VVFSAPCDAHLVVARTVDTDSYACFYVPRFSACGRGKSPHAPDLNRRFATVGVQRAIPDEGLLVGVAGVWKSSSAYVPVEQPTKFELAINLKTSGATAVTYCR
jgi:hypothetical protein